MKNKEKELQVGEIYLVKKVGIGEQKVFLDKKDYCRLVLMLEFYNSHSSANLWSLFFYKSRNKEMFNEEDVLRFSFSKKKCHKERKFKKRTRKRVWEKREEHRQKKGGRIVSVLGFVLLPKRFYLLVKEVESGGTVKFMQKLGGYSYYFNRKHKRKGALFYPGCTYQHVKSKKEALSVLHYLHLKPFQKRIKRRDSCYVRDKGLRKKRLLERVSSYRYSSFRDYIGKRNFPSVTNRGLFLDYLRGRKEYKRSILYYVKNNF